MTQIVLPNDANTHGNVLGGKVMHEIDLTGAIAAYRHCRQPVVTVSVDSVHFHHPVKVGDLMLLEAVITRAFTTSMEVEVEVRSENPLTGEQKRTCSAYLTFVAIDSSGRPSAVPPLLVETADEERRYEGALKRRQYRLTAGSEE
jgi:acyl-CoA hydrolase